MAIAAGAAALNFTGGILDAYGQYLGNKQQRNQNNLQADYLLKQAYLNGIAADKNISNLQEYGREQMSAITDNFQNTESDSRVVAAINGVDITKGSAQEVANASYLNYIKDTNALSKNIGTQISDIQSQANMDNYNAEYRARNLKAQNKYLKNTQWIGLTSSLLGTSAQSARMLA